MHVLFVDLVGFTSLAERLDPEETSRLQDHYFSAVAGAVIEAGGHVEKYIGDAVMAVFGMPRSRDDDAVRVVGTALKIVEIVGSLPEGIGMPAGSMRVRVGVNTGEVVAHWVDGAASWRLTGDVVNTAARLQTRAAPDVVLVGAETALAVHQAFVTEPIGAVALAGKANGVPAWKVSAPRPRGSAGWGLLGQQVPTIDRRAELAHLAELLARPKPNSVLIIAPPGTGKSRLLREFERRVRAASGVVYHTKITADSTAAATVSELLRCALGPAGAATDIGRVVAKLAERQLNGPRAVLAAEHALATLAGDVPQARPSDLWTSWTAVLDAHGGDTGAPAWLLDDAHLAGEDLRGFLGHAQTKPQREQRLIVLAARPAAGVSPGDEPFGPTEVTALHPLPAGSLVELIAALAGDGVVPRPVMDAVATASGGNPLFVVELLRSWAQHRTLRALPDGRWVFDGGELLRLPSTVHAIYLGQLDELPEAARDVTQLASVVGLTFPAGLLPTLGVPEPGDPLKFLTSSGLLEGPRPGPLGPACYSFRHALLRETAYATLPRMRRAHLHIATAGWFAGWHSPPAERVARHLEEALREAPRVGFASEQPDRKQIADEAAGWFERAGDERLATEPHAAADMFGRAYTLSSTNNDAARRQLQRAEALRRSNQLEAALDAFAHIRSPTGPKAVALLAQQALGYENALFGSRLPRSQWGDRSLDLITNALWAVPEGSLELRSRLLAARARARAYNGATVAAAADATDAVTCARHARHSGALGHALLARRAVLAEPEHREARLREADELIEAARRSGDIELEIDGTRLQFVDLLEHGDLAAADRARSRAEGLIRQLGQPQHMWYIPMWHAMRALLTGDPEAGHRIEQFRAGAERWNYRDAVLVHAVQLLELLTVAGCPEIAVEHIEQVATSAHPRFRAVLAAAQCRAGRVKDGVAHLDTLVRPDFAGADQDRSYVLSLVVEVAAAAGESDACAALAHDLEPWVDGFVVLGSGALCLGSAALFVGLAQRAAGDVQGALVHFTHAVIANDRAGIGPPAVRSRMELARTLTLLGRHGEARRAGSRASALALRIGMDRWLEQQRRRSQHTIPVTGVG